MSKKPDGWVGKDIQFPLDGEIHHVAIMHKEVAEGFRPVILISPAKAEWIERARRQLLLFCGVSTDDPIYEKSAKLLSSLEAIENEEGRG